MVFHDTSPFVILELQRTTNSVLTSYTRTFWWVHVSYPMSNSYRTNMCIWLFTILRNTIILLGNSSLVSKGNIQWVSPLLLPSPSSLLFWSSFNEMFVLSWIISFVILHGLFPLPYSLRCFDAFSIWCALWLDESKCLY